VGRAPHYPTHRDGRVCNSAFFTLVLVRRPGVVFSVAVVLEPELASVSEMNYTLVQKKKRRDDVSLGSLMHVWLCLSSRFFSSRARASAAG
jgi:hypothetical protein